VVDKGAYRWQINGEETLTHDAGTMKRGNRSVAGAGESNMEATDCSLGMAGTPLEVREIRIDPGLGLKRYALLASPDGCCSQTVLPFAARVIGTVANLGHEERCVTVTVTLYDPSGSLSQVSRDLLYIDPSGQGEFDVKLSEAVRGASQYSLYVEATGDPAV
jgi:hypothetical protein